MIFGIFANRNHAGEAVSELKDKGYNNISVITRDNAGDIKETNVDDNPVDDVAGGAVTGGALGGLAGILAGIAAVALPGVGPILIGGPLAVSWGVTGAALGALAGGIAAALSEAGVPEDVAKGYEMRIQGGDVLVSVDSDDDEEVQAILRSHNAEEVTTTST